jgi:hypothetical protein
MKLANRYYELETRNELLNIDLRALLSIRSIFHRKEIKREIAGTREKIRYNELELTSIRNQLGIEV